MAVPTASSRGGRHGWARCAALVLCLTGCATSGYVRRMEPAQLAFYQGDAAAAAARLAADFEQADDTDRHLLGLERAMALQAQGRFAEAAELMMQADQRLEVLDYSHAPVTALADTLFSLRVGTWKATPPEKVLVNTQNMINFLGAGDVEEAAVEARRVGILLQQEDLPEEERYANPLAWALAGLIFERAGKPGEAAEAFREAGPTGLEKPAVPGDGTLLVLVQNGRVPVRVQAVYQLWLGGKLRRLQIPELVRRPGGAARAAVWLDGEPAGEASVLLDLQGQALQRYRREFPRLLAAAVLQMVPRAVLSDALRRTAKDSGKDAHAGRNVLAELGATVFEQALGEWFPVDTRCWSLLPGEIRALRLNVPPGEHTLAVALPGTRVGRIERTVTVTAGGLSLVNIVTALGDGPGRRPAPGSGNITGTRAGMRALELVLAERQIWRHHD